MQTQNIFSYTLNDLNGDPVPLKQYEGKVLLLVNTASRCGFTPQFEQLEQLYQQYHAQGFEILAFPSNDFGQQEPLSGKEISEFCAMHYETNFPLFEKIHVTGQLVHPLYHMLAQKKWYGMFSIVPKWNFHKYLVNSKGELVDFYLPFTSPMNKKIGSKIETLLAEIKP